MTEHAALAALEAELETLRQAGQKSVEVESLLVLITNLRSEPPVVSLDLARRNALAQLEIEAHKGREAQWAADRAFQHEATMEVFRSVIASGATANKAALAINGGGAVALLAFLGHLAANATPAALMATVTPSVQWFVVGTLAAACSAGATYLAQFFYNREGVKWERCGDVTNGIAIIVWLGSLTSFGFGALGASSALAALG